eukprot:scaffold17544_cov63-Phaeocystis_antarctica.AAC.5
MRAQLRTPSVSKRAVSSSVRFSILASALGAATASEGDAAAAFALRRGGIALWWRTQTAAWRSQKGTVFRFTMN